MEAAPSPTVPLASVPVKQEVADPPASLPTPGRKRKAEHPLPNPAHPPPTPPSKRARPDLTPLQEILLKRKGEFVGYLRTSLPPKFLPYADLLDGTDIVQFEVQLRQKVLPLKRLNLLGFTIARLLRHYGIDPKENRRDA